MERVIAVLGLLVQILNAGAFIFQLYLPEHAVLVAAITGGIQAFLGKIQEKKSPVKRK